MYKRYKRKKKTQSGSGFPLVVAAALPFAKAALPRQYLVVGKKEENVEKNIKDM